MMASYQCENMSLAQQNRDREGSKKNGIQKGAPHYLLLRYQCFLLFCQQAQSIQ